LKNLEPIERTTYMYPLTESVPIHTKKSDTRKSESRRFL